MEKRFILLYDIKIKRDKNRDKSDKMK